MNFINGKYTPYKIYFLNRSNNSLETNFVIYNLISKAEAIHQATQVAAYQAQKSVQQSNAWAMNGGLIGIGMSMATETKAKSIINSQDKTVNFLNTKLLDDKQNYLSFNLSAKDEEKNYLFLMPKKLTDQEIQLTVCYKSSVGKEKCFNNNIENTITENIFKTNKAWTNAFKDNKIQDNLVSGIYIDSKPISAKKIREKEEKISKNSKATKLVEFLANSSSENLINPKSNNLYILQNIKNLPNVNSLEFVKLTPDKKQNYRKVANTKIAVKTKTDEKKQVYISNLNILQAGGEYLILDKNTDLVYEFTIEKPATTNTKNK